VIKVFAYHNGFNGVSMYRVWQPMKYLSKMEGFKVKQLPERSERVIWQGLEGPCNIPTIGSHAEIVENNDVIFSNFANSMQNSARLWAQAQLKPLIIDIDDDIENIEEINPNYKAWHQDDGAQDKLVDITPENEEDLKRMAAQNRGNFVELSGVWYFHEHRIPLKENVYRAMEKAALVTVSTERLKKLYKPHAQNIVVIPNGIDFDNFPVLPERKNDGFIRLGLFGSNTHYWDWKELAPVLKKILDDFPNVKLCFNSWFTAVSKPGQSLEEMEKRVILPEIFEKLGINGHERVEIHEPVEIGDYFEWLSRKSIDIGLAPLRDSIFNRAKSNIKYLEWAALRTPVIAQDIEVYNEDIKHGFNGMLAGSKQEWHQCLVELIRNEKLRHDMGQRAYLDAKSRYDMPIIARKLAGEIKKLLGVENESIEDRAAGLGLVLAK